MVLASLRRIHKNLPCKGERQIHADNISTQQPPSRASTSSVRTQPLSYRGPNISWETRGCATSHPLNMTICRTDTTHSSFLHPSTRATKTTHTSEGGEFWALSYTWPPASHLHRLPAHFEAKKKKQLTHGSRPKLAPTPDEDWHPEKTQHPPRQTSPDTTDDAHRYFAAQQHESCQSLCPSRTVFFSFFSFSGLSIASRTTYFRKKTLPTLADGDPTDPVDESHLEPSCSQSHWLQHKTTDEDKTLLTTPWSTLKAHSRLPHGYLLFSLALPMSSPLPFSVLTTFLLNYPFFLKVHF